MIGQGGHMNYNQYTHTKEIHIPVKKEKKNFVKSYDQEIYYINLKNKTFDLSAVANALLKLRSAMGLLIFIF